VSFVSFVLIQGTDDVAKLDPITYRVAIAIGSNLGDRRAHLDFAVGRLGTLLVDLNVSSYLETEPVGTLEPQPLFFNAAAVGDSSLSARALLDALLEIERERGRARPYPNAARTLDLDLILFGDQTIDTSGLVVPHPRFRERRFVLQPLAEIAPAMLDPMTGQTVAELLNLVANKSDV
jgi:2-amino-4-hydroxy-6-hydroxymethyldihydropteridine diphosphokinase